MSEFCNELNDTIAARHCQILSELFSYSEEGLDVGVKKCTFIKNGDIKCEPPSPDGVLTSPEIYKVLIHEAEKEYKELVLSIRTNGSEIETPLLDRLKREKFEIPWLFQDITKIRMAIKKMEPTSKLAAKHDPENTKSTLDYFTSLFETIFAPKDDGGFEIKFIKGKYLPQLDIAGTIERGTMRCVESLFLIRGLAFIANGPLPEMLHTCDRSSSQHVFASFAAGATYLLDAEESSSPMVVDSSDPKMHALPITELELLATYRIIKSMQCLFLDHHKKDLSCAKENIEWAKRLAPSHFMTILGEAAYHGATGEILEKSDALKRLEKEAPVLFPH